MPALASVASGANRNASANPRNPRPPSQIATVPSTRIATLRGRKATRDRMGPHASICRIPRRRVPVLTLAADDAAALRSIGWRDAQLAGIPEETQSDRRVLRIVAQHRSGYRCHDGREEIPVQAPARYSRGGADPLAKPAVGDWVLVAPGPEPLIESVLPRRTLLARAA